MTALEVKLTDESGYVKVDGVELTAKSLVLNATAGSPTIALIEAFVDEAFIDAVAGLGIKLFTQHCIHCKAMLRRRESPWAVAWECDCVLEDDNE